MAENRFLQFVEPPASDPDLPKTSAASESNRFLQFTTGTPDTPPTARVTVRPEGVVPEAQGEGPEQPEMGALPAFGTSAVQGATANFGDELAGLYAAGGGWRMTANPIGAVAPAVIGLARLGYEKLTGQDQPQQPDLDQPPIKGPGTTAYEQARDRWRATVERAERQHPVASTAGQVTGALATPIRAAAATRLGLSARSAALGAGMGGAAGLGEGVDIGDRLAKGATGLVTGGVVGAAAPFVAEGIARAGRGIFQPAMQFIRGVRDPESEAARRTTQAAVAAQRRGGPRVLTADEYAAAQARGQPVAAIDMTGREGRTLARSTRNTPGADDGAEALEQMVSDRFASQARRAADFIDRLTVGRVPVERLRERVNAANAPAYRRAYADAEAMVMRNPDALWTPELQRLSGAPDIRQAMASVGRKEGNRSIIAGRQMPRQNPFAPDGVRMQPRDISDTTRAVPDLPVWDSVQRMLRGRIGEAVRAGNDEMARDLTLLRQSLLREIDRIVPSFRDARGTAFRGFRAEDAYEAGENYVKMNVTGQARRELEQTIQNMSGRDRVLFMAGFATRLIEDVRKMPDAQDVVRRIYSSPAARQRIIEALGERRSRELEAYLHVESVMNHARRAVSGNSTTAMQLLSAGAAGGLGYGAVTGNWDWTNLLAGAGAAAGRHRMRGAEARLASRIGEMLSSDNPDVFIRGIQMVAQSERMMNRLRQAGTNVGARSLPPQTTGIAGPQAGSVGRADDERERVPGP